MFKILEQSGKLETMRGQITSVEGRLTHEWITYIIGHDRLHEKKEFICSLFNK